MLSGDSYACHIVYPLDAATGVTTVIRISINVNTYIYDCYKIFLKSRLSQYVITRDINFNSYKRKKVNHSIWTDLSRPFALSQDSKKF